MYFSGTTARKVAKLVHTILHAAVVFTESSSNSSNYEMDNNVESDDNHAMAIGKVFTVSAKTNPDNPNLTRKPCARSGHAAVATNKNLYMYGGYNPSNIRLEPILDEVQMLDRSPLFKEMWRFNFDDQSWSKVENHGTVPLQLASMSMTRCGDVIVLYGGTGFPFGYQMDSSLYCFSIRDARWRMMSGSKEVPDSTYGQSVSVAGSSLFMFGGTSGWDYNANVYKCDLRTGIWEKCFDFEKHFTMLIERQLDDKHVPLPRYRHEMLCDEESLYVIGGGTSHYAFTLESMHIFNTRSYTWSNRQSLPDPVNGFPEKRRCHGCCQLGNEGYITGGFDGTNIFDDVWRLSLDSLQWTKLQARLPQPVYFHSSTITPEGCLYYHGGVLNRDGSLRTNKLNFLWVRVPSLETLAWRCLLRQNPSIRRLTDEVLRGLGIPEHIIKR